MPRFACLAIALVIAPPVIAADYPAPAPVTAAEIHPEGGYVTRRASVQMEPGRHRILIPAGRPQFGAPEITVTGGASVVSVSWQDNGVHDVEAYLTPAQQALVAAVKALEDEDEALRARRVAIEARLDAAEARAAFAEALVPPTESAPSLEELQAMAGFIAEEKAAVAEERATVRAALRAMKEDLDDLGKRLAAARAARDRAGLPDEGDPVMVLDVIKSGGDAAEVEFRTLVGNIGWEFHYEAELMRGEAASIGLTRRVSLRQDSGQPWNGIDLVLQASSLRRALDPTEVFPNLAAIYERPMPVERFGGAVTSMAAPDARSMEPALMEMAQDGFVAGEAGVEGLAVSYRFPEPVTLMAGDSAQLVLDRLEFAASDHLQAVPRWDQTAFVMAEFTNDGETPILPGQTSFLRDGQLVGVSHTGMIAPGQEVTWGFGPFDGIQLDMNFDRNETGDQGLIRSSNTRRQRVTLTVENLTGAEQDVRTIHALPFSEQEALRVFTTPGLEWDEVDYDGKRNVAVWNLSVAPGEKREIQLDMSLNWPEGQELDWQP